MITEFLDSTIDNAARFNIKIKEFQLGSKPFVEFIREATITMSLVGGYTLPKEVIDPHYRGYPIKLHESKDAIVFVLDFT